MKRLLTLSMATLLGVLPSAWAQDEMDGPAATSPLAKPASKIMPPADAEKSSPNGADQPATPAAPVGTMNDMPVAQLQALDKITARVSHMEIKVGDTATFGSLNIAVKACRKAPPENTPESAAFLQIWEKKPGEDSQWVYRGWMFASSPALAAMDHAVYDIWLVDCSSAPTSSDSSKPQ